MRKASQELKENKQEYAKDISLEMGKPIKQAIAEIEKCAWVCEYYAENAEKHLAPKTIKTDAHKSYVSYEPIGVVLAVMPWNYPFWQVFRFAAPALMAGNIGVLKHASSVMKSANNIQKVFERAGFPDGCFQNLVLGSSKIEDIIRDSRIKAVTLTGSKPAGGAVASVAGEEIKNRYWNSAAAMRWLYLKMRISMKPLKPVYRRGFRIPGRVVLPGNACFFMSPWRKNLQKSS